MMLAVMCWDLTHVIMGPIEVINGFAKLIPRERIDSFPGISPQWKPTTWRDGTLVCL